MKGLEKSEDWEELSRATEKYSSYPDEMEGCKDAKTLLKTRLDEVLGATKDALRQLSPENDVKKIDEELANVAKYPPPTGIY